MNLASAIVVGVVVLGAAAALFYMHRRARAGKSSLCAGCALKNLCNKK